jgi:hypothetical protein
MLPNVSRLQPVHPSQWCYPFQARQKPRNRRHPHPSQAYRRRRIAKTCLHLRYWRWLLRKRNRHLEAVSVALEYLREPPTSRPASLASHDMDRIQTSADFLNMANGLHHIIEIRSSRVADVLTLPVGESICKTAHKVSLSGVHIASQTHSSLTPPLIRGSAVPSAYLFQLSAVPIVTFGNML